MRDPITAEVQESFARSTDERFRKIMQALVHHAHAFVADVSLTHTEWEAAIGFLTEVGKTCTTERQEFILLSDTLGISTLVDNIDYSSSETATEGAVIGPFFVEGAPSLVLGSDIAGTEPGEPLFINGKVVDCDGEPVRNATVDIWQSNARGFYDVQNDEREGYCLRGRFQADMDGGFHLWSIRPEKYPIPNDGPVGRMLIAANRHPYRPAHVHFKIQAPGFRTIVTQIFDAESEYLSGDAVFGVKPSLIQDFTLVRGPVQDGRDIDVPWRVLEREFVLMRSSTHSHL